MLQHAFNKIISIVMGTRLKFTHLLKGQKSLKSNKEDFEQKLELNFGIKDDDREQQKLFTIVVDVEYWLHHNDVVTHSVNPRIVKNQYKICYTPRYELKFSSLESRVYHNILYAERILQAYEEGLKLIKSIKEAMTSYVFIESKAITKAISYLDNTSAKEQFVKVCKKHNDMEVGELREISLIHFPAHCWIYEGDDTRNAINVEQKNGLDDKVFHIHAKHGLNHFYITREI